MPISPQQLAFLPMKDQFALLDWLREHGDWHRLVAQKAVDRGHLNLGTYDVTTMGDRDDWLYFHNSEHENIASTFNISSPPDLSYWDQEEEVNFNNWLQAHALTHDNERKVLGL
jgi:hypothetical protein